MGEKRESRRKERQLIYNTKRWKDLRKLFVQAHPLCEKCLKEGKITPTENIHHILSPFAPGLTPEERDRRAYSWSNLMALCVECHIKEHHKDELTIIEKLDKYKD